MKERIVDVLRKDPSDELIHDRRMGPTKRTPKTYVSGSQWLFAEGIQIVFDKNTFSNLSTPSIMLSHRQRRHL